MHTLDMRQSKNNLYIFQNNYSSRLFTKENKENFVFHFSQHVHSNTGSVTEKFKERKPAWHEISQLIINEAFLFLFMRVWAIKFKVKNKIKLF